MISLWTATATNTGFESRMRKPACFAAGGFYIQNGGETCDRKRFTEKWVEMINRIEQAETKITEKRQ